jgi:cytochrome c peroxidase
VKQLAKFLIACALPWAVAMAVTWPGTTLPGVSTTVAAAGKKSGGMNRELREVLAQAGFTGDIERTYKKRLKESLGRPINPKLAELGRLLWFDNFQSIGRDNTCGGCHSPSNGMGDSQPMAIGVQSNLVVGPHRTGPRNQRRTPTVVNTALFPRLMWNSRFESLSGDPFDPSQGFSFPVPEDAFPFTPVRFSAAENARNGITHLLQAQAHMPPTELIEVGGFLGACAQPDLDLWCAAGFDFGSGQPVPDVDSSGFRNEPIRQMALAALNGNAAYRKLFGQIFKEVKKGAPIDFFMFGKAIAEFEFTLVFADAPLDKFARGHDNAMSDSEKRGGLLFFGKANCVSCHRVDGHSNEMFSDFQEHVVGVPQIFPSFGVNTGNFPFAGPGMNEDFGRQERTGDEADRYTFRTAPLRNLRVSPGFFHNGAYITLEDAIRFHLSVVESAKNYDPDAAGVPSDLRQVGPLVPEPLIAPSLKKAIKLTNTEFNDLVRFVKDALTDDRVEKSNLCGLIPARVPSGLPVLTFEECPAR